MELRRLMGLCQGRHEIVVISVWILDFHVHTFGGNLLTLPQALYSSGVRLKRFAISASLSESSTFAGGSLRAGVEGISEKPVAPLVSSSFSSSSRWRALTSLYAISKDPFRAFNCIGSLATS